MAKLSKAPVFLVLAQVRHSPVLKLDALIPEFQERLRKKGFPLYTTGKQTAINIVVDDAQRPGDATVNQHEQSNHTLLSADEASAFIASPDSIVFRTTKFDGFESFVKTFAEVLDVYQETVGPDLVTGMGLRYLDAVIPGEGEQISAYVRKEFLGLTEILGDDWITAYDFYETVLQRAGQTVKFRTLCRSAPVQFPIDLAGIVTSLPDRIPKQPVVHALLDSDATFTPKESMSFDVPTVKERFTSLKKDISEVFKAAVTSEALQAWE